MVCIWPVKICPSRIDLHVKIGHGKILCTKVPTMDSTNSVLVKNVIKHGQHLAASSRLILDSFMYDKGYSNTLPSASNCSLPSKISI